jgi:hypothetical protein
MCDGASEEIAARLAAKLGSREHSIILQSYLSKPGSFAVSLGGEQVYK